MLVARRPKKKEEKNTLSDVTHQNQLSNGRHQIETGLTSRIRYIDARTEKNGKIEAKQDIFRTT